ncbi:cell cycle regulator of non-homologous end joining-like [Spea bombifrons]|uniref:cell cycle regulator of non-homologous end joining-like n=1 Tax=Spea bombifrons TaxID=233779 RepID=UPI00234900BA|nr:cell cycle regulator of non-homologous end joining-like [Spea bombifrons]XP_053318682.1 cell cycle regulator of non-homologous end joining-like [Spea bombifrons]
MEEEESKEKKRVLPQWMTDAKSDSNRARDLKRKKVISPRKQPVYCMNEMELVACALEIINQGKRFVDTEEVGLDEQSDDLPAGTPAGTSSTYIPPPTNKENPRSPIKGFRKPTAGVRSDDDDDDPLKFVREIFFS